jgi:hypothetical protein
LLSISAKKTNCFNVIVLFLKGGLYHGRTN